MGVEQKKTNRKRPPTAGRKKKDARIVGPFKLATDVADILDAVPNKTAYIEEAIREKSSTSQAHNHM